MNDEVMIDLETMGTGSNAAIVAIGGVAFSFGRRTITSEFYQRISLQESVVCGFDMDADTVLWWMRQSDEVRKEVFEEGGVHPNVALLNFISWCGNFGPRDDLKVWGNGSDFDNLILSNAYARQLLTAPWSFRGNRCFRTIKNLFPVPDDIKPTRQGVAHHALHDALHQTEHLLVIAKYWEDHRMAFPGGRS
ncbi:MAG: 3'-5' exoribonuclease [Alphaproteobacteria bacterium CG_4_10_14_0_2_um_filter_63_37]|nr:MAG: 3'-5' exoribonuclease [Alphaproteobacteria bacterium CG_4_10_14_0_2_um_filter_63_37]